jgi:hypothetical protein
VAAMYSGKPYIVYDLIKNPGWDYKILLPKGNYELLFTRSAVSEQNAAMVVEVNKWYRDYVNWPDYSCTTALESWNSWLQSKNIHGNYAVVIKK